MATLTSLVCLAGFAIVALMAVAVAVRPIAGRKRRVTRAWQFTGS